MLNVCEAGAGLSGESGEDGEVAERGREGGGEGEEGGCPERSEVQCCRAALGSPND